MFLLRVFLFFIEEPITLLLLTECTVTGVEVCEGRIHCIWFSLDKRAFINFLKKYLVLKRDFLRLKSLK